MTEHGTGPDRRARLRGFLAAVRRRWFAQEALGAAARAAGAAGLAGFTALILYFLFAPAGFGLVLLALSALLVALTTAGWAVARMRGRPDDRQVARFIEERAAAMPDGVAFEDALVTAADERPDGDRTFGALLVTAAVERLGGLRPSDVVPTRALRRRVFEAGASLFALALVLAWSAAPLERAIDTARLLFYPGSIEIDVLPGDVRLVGGEAVRIRAVFRAGDRILTSLEPSLTVAAGAGRRTVPMTADGDGFVVPFESVDRTFRYVVAAGAASSREYTVTALFPPRIERIDLVYEYPAFTGLPPREEEDGGDIYAPAGTRVRVRVHADKPLAAAELAFAGGAAAALARVADGVAETELTLARDDSYRVRLSDTDGLHTAGGVEYFIRLMDDRPPEVRILRPAADRRITPLEEVAIEARADDDHGIASLELVYAVAGGPSRTVPFATITAAGSAKLGAHVLAAEDLDVEPGDVITYYARARDVGRGKRPTAAQSDMYFLEVRPFGEEFVAAQSGAGGAGAAGARIESLIAAQKEIISATWNIERRASAGRSSKDVAAIALAQAELKARAQRMASRRGRGGLDFPQQIRPERGRRPGGRNPEGVSTAIAAMARAVSELQGERTKDALAHEMAALQALLQVQAEIRRRQVAMQQHGGGSGGDSASEDLSALFDKELQRQQSTRYENRESLAERADRRDEESALDRIRDLARRQEELSRRQRELADAALDAEARKRQLERLTREQEALQQQVEELARRTAPASRGASAQQQDGQAQNGQQQGRGSGRGSPGTETGSDRRNPFQDASEQMRGAAGALGRDDVKGAAEQASRAAEQLRQVEQLMRGDSPEARRRAAGDLQLEAQQIAGEQGRIAAEAARLDKADPQASADGRRRLAGEKDQLVERVDGLERAARSLANGAREGESAEALATRAGAAARELEEQKLGARMRDTAEAMRAESSAPTAPGEQELAQALERIAGQLGGGAADADSLRGLLEETKGIRDRLDRLARQLAGAERKDGQPGAASAGGAQQGQTEEARRAEAERLRQEYGRELERAREALDRLQAAAPSSGEGGSSPERHEWSVADPGTQGYKQDFSGWESLRQDIDLALGRVEAAASAKLARQAAQDRLSAGGSERVPDAYERLIARYYEALARGKKK